MAIRVADDGVKDDHILQCVHKRFSQGIIIRFDRWHPALFHKLPNRHISPTIQSDLVELSIREFLKYCDFDVEDYSRFVTGVIKRIASDFAGVAGITLHGVNAASVCADYDTYMVCAAV